MNSNKSDDSFIEENILYSSNENFKELNIIIIIKTICFCFSTLMIIFKNSISDLSLVVGLKPMVFYATIIKYKKNIL